MGNCKILNCKTKKGERTFFNVPHEPIVRSKWIEQISRHQQFDERPQTYPVCCLHFNEDEITKSGKRSVLKKGAVPTSFPDPDGNYSVYNPMPETKSKPKQKIPDDSLKENELPSVNRVEKLPQMISITSTEYGRLLQNEVKMIKFKELCQNKAGEVKRLQDLVAYYKRQAMNKTSHGDDDSQVQPKADVGNGL